MVLVDALDDWYTAEDYRKDAEEVYEHMRNMYPVGDTEFPKQESQLVLLRSELDILAEEQKENRPQYGRDKVPEEDDTDISMEGANDKGKTAMKQSAIDKKQGGNSDEEMLDEGKNMARETIRSAGMGNSDDDMLDKSKSVAKETTRSLSNSDEEMPDEGKSTTSSNDTAAVYGSSIDDPFSTQAPSLTEGSTAATTTGGSRLSFATSPFSTPMPGRFREVASENPERVSTFSLTTPMAHRFQRPETDQATEKWSTPEDQPIAPFIYGSGGTLKRLGTVEGAHAGSPAKKLKEEGTEPEKEGGAKLEKEEDDDDEDYTMKAQSPK